MDSSDLRNCPFCANRKLKLVVWPKDGVETLTIQCSECGATGPVATRKDGTGHAEFLWNLRHGVGIEH
jgi:transcription elongation factor Elf1